MLDQPPAGGALRELARLVGRWRLIASGPGGEPWPGAAESEFSWHESGAHLVCRTSVEAPAGPGGVSIIGADAANGTYFQLYSDDRGVARVFEMSIDEHEWRLWREGAPFAQRFIGRFEDAGRRIDGRWEKAEGGAGLAVDFHLTYLRSG